jgi:anti-sigma factor RsiW
MSNLISHQASQPDEAAPYAANEPASRRAWTTGRIGWSVAALLLIVFVGTIVLQRTARVADTVSAQHAALVTEVCDQHIATLATILPPQVVSTDRHTVKPWFQGKLPFSFNLPDKLPPDTTLDGANLTYLHSQPVAQLLYSIGRHRVSVFVGAAHPPTNTSTFISGNLGFHVSGFSTAGLDVVAVSDVDERRLQDLVDAMEQAQSASHR